MTQVVKKQICPTYISIGHFKICYVQPMPLPPHVMLLKQLQAEGLDFVKIPVTDKEDRLYLRGCILRLLRTCNVHNDYVEGLLDDYNNVVTGSTVDSRQKLLNLVSVARDYCYCNNLEFLIESE